MKKPQNNNQLVHLVDEVAFFFNTDVLLYDLFDIYPSCYNFPCSSRWCVYLASKNRICSSDMTRSPLHYFSTLAINLSLFPPIDNSNLKLHSFHCTPSYRI